MNNISSFLDSDGACLIFDHLTVEIHIWNIIRNQTGEIDTWRLIYVNPPALRTWGRDSLDDIKGKTTDEIFGEGSSKHYMSVVKRIMLERTPHTYQDYFPNLKKHFKFTSVPLDEYFITTGTDITDFVVEKDSMLSEKIELERRIQQRTAELESTEEEIRTLKGIIPICSYCHSIRDEEGSWDQLEAYISKHSDAMFSHGICPKCISSVRKNAGLIDNHD